MAYYLLEIFDVNMPLLYGEGVRRHSLGSKRGSLKKLTISLYLHEASDYRTETLKAQSSPSNHPTSLDAMTSSPIGHGNPCKLRTLRSPKGALYLDSYHFCSQK